MDIKTTVGKIISKTGEGESLKDAVIRLIANHANLSVANLRGANLSGAELRWANLSGAKQRIVIIQAVRHQIVAIDDDVRIGCHRKKLSDWLASYESVGRNEGYTEDEISLYGRLLKSLEE